MYAVQHFQIPKAVRCVQYRAIPIQSANMLSMAESLKEYPRKKLQGRAVLAELPPVHYMPCTELQSHAISIVHHAHKRGKQAIASKQQARRHVISSF
jgi:hypothetical protein